MDIATGDIPGHGHRAAANQVQPVGVIAFGKQQLVGMQGKAALHDLALNEEVTAITAADYDLEALQAFVSAGRFGDKVRCEFLDAAGCTDRD